MRLLVTGGAGFVGSHLVERLCREGHEVRVLDNFSTGNARNLIEVQGEVELLVGDVRELERVREAAAECEVILHQAALPSVPRSIRVPLETHHVNALGTLNVLIAASQERVRRVVIASSSSVYGDTDVLPQHEGLAPTPVSPYAVSKLAAEGYGCAFARVHGLETVSLRYFNVFGPRQRRGVEYTGAIPSFVNALLSGARPRVHGDGLQSRDFTYIDNVVEANLLAMRSRIVDGRSVNVACGEAVTILEVLAELADLTGRPAAPLHCETRPGDLRHSLADLRRARSELGYAPRISAREGLARTIGYYERELPAAELESLAPPESSA